MITKASLFIEIEPIPCLVKRQYLTDFKSSFGEFEKGKIVSVWSYKGHMPTFMVLLEDGTIFSYLPSSAFVLSDFGISCSETISVTDSCNTYCPSENFVLYRLSIFDDISKKNHLFNSKKNYIGVAQKYLFSLEWPEENELVHLFVHDDQLRFVPNHKLLVLNKDSATLSLPTDWKKLRTEWTKPKDK